MDPSTCPQLFHHRPHRSRQVDAGRPPSRGHRGAPAARDGGAGARLDGPRAGARHHHQGASGPAELHGRRRADLRAEPDRYARARRLFYEVSRSLAACEGALLLVDASQGVEAQTLANAYLAVEHNLEIIPSSTRSICRARNRRKRGGRSRTSSASTGRAPSSPAPRKASASPRFSKPSSRGCRRRRATRRPLKALIFDSWYDAYRGVVIVVRVLDGTLRQGHEDPPDGAGPGLRDRSDWRVLAEAGADRRAGSRARSASSWRTSRRSATRRSATRSPRRTGRAEQAFPGFKGAEADGVRGPVPGRRAADFESCAKRWRSCG